MARVTVEDCLEHVDNRFELILVAAKRAHQLNNGSHKSILPAQGDKSSVIALREVARGLVDASILEETYEIINPQVGGVDVDEVKEELSNNVMEEKLAEEVGISIDEPDLGL